MTLVATGGYVVLTTDTNHAHLMDIDQAKLKEIIRLLHIKPKHDTDPFASKTIRSIYIYGTPPK
jgi:hypothetical protein